MNRDKEYTKKYANIALNLGFVPILILPNSKRPMFAGWPNITSSEAEKTFNKIRSFHNIGIITGKASGIVVLDIEKADLDDWYELLEQHPKLKETLTVRTGGGGLHIYFDYDSRTEKIRNGVKIKLPITENKFAKVDVRTTGGQVLWIGDVHPETGKTYKVISGVEQFENQETGELEDEYIISPMPKWLANAIIEAQSKIGRRR